MDQASVPTVGGFEAADVFAPHQRTPGQAVPPGDDAALADAPCVGSPRTGRFG
jgi:hypothetical protein